MKSKLNSPCSPTSPLSPAEREEMLRLQEQGDLPEVIDRSTDLYFRFLLGNPARTELLRNPINSLFGALGYPLLTKVDLADSEREPEKSPHGTSPRPTDERAKKRLTRLSSRTTSARRPLGQRV